MKVVEVLKRIQQRKIKGGSNTIGVDIVTN